ncbi:MAG: hypothetical protein ACKN97_05810 [Acidobacteriota bacterium]
MSDIIVGKYSNMEPNYPLKDGEADVATLFERLASRVGYWVGRMLRNRRGIYQR